MAYVYRHATSEDWNAVSDVLFASFHESPDEITIAAERKTWEPERAVVAELDGTIRGHASSFTRDLAVPGATVPTAHVTMISVDATHRRQGLLNTMIDMLHQDAAEHGEPIAALWASEGGIYQRYGYGLASQRAAVGGLSAEVRWREPGDGTRPRLRAVPPTDTAPMREVYERVWRDRPGHSSRNDAWWGYITTDSDELRDGATPIRAVIHDDEHGRPDGYLLWRVKKEWNDLGHDGTVRVLELIAENPLAYRALWEFVLAVDLTRHFFQFFAAPDEPIVTAVTDPRRLGMKISDALYVRILDLPAALRARRYAAPVDVVLEVSDPRIPANAGRWRLRADGDSVSCDRTEDPADLAVPVNALGSAYLGGISLARMAAAGGVTELRPGTLAAASTAFGWARLPSSLDIF